jgi:hypothetical protein
MCPTTETRSSSSISEPIRTWIQVIDPALACGHGTHRIERAPLGPASRAHRQLRGTHTSHVPENDGRRAQHTAGTVSLLRLQTTPQWRCALSHAASRTRAAGCDTHCARWPRAAEALTRAFDDTPGVRSDRCRGQGRHADCHPQGHRRVARSSARAPAPRDDAPLEGCCGSAFRRRARAQVRRVSGVSMQMCVCGAERDAARRAAKKVVACCTAPAPHRQRAPEPALSLHS